MLIALTFFDSCECVNIVCGAMGSVCAALDQGYEAVGVGMCCHLLKMFHSYVLLDVDEDDRHIAGAVEHGGSVGIGVDANVELNGITKLNAKYTDPNKWFGGWKR